MRETILFSIRKEHVDRIRRGEKIVEYRSILPAKLHGKELPVLFYETKTNGGTGAIVGSAHTCGWDLVWDPKHGIDKIAKQATQAEREYIMKTGGAYAIKLTKIRFFDKPVRLEKYGVKKAPQSFMYIEEEVGPMI